MRLRICKLKQGRSRLGKLGLLLSLEVTHAFIDDLGVCQVLIGRLLLAETLLLQKLRVSVLLAKFDLLEGIL